MVNSPAGWCPGCGGKIRQLLLKVLSRALSCPGQLFPPCFQVQKGLGGWYAFKPCLGIVLVSFFFLPGHLHIITLLFGSRCQNRPQLLPLGSCCACSLVFSQLALLFTPKALSFTDRPPEASIPGSMSDPAVPVELSSDSKTRAARQYAEGWGAPGTTCGIRSGRRGEEETDGLWYTSCIRLRSWPSTRWTCQCTRVGLRDHFYSVPLGYPAPRRPLSEIELTELYPRSWFFLFKNS